MDPAHAPTFFQELAAAVADLQIIHGGNTISITASFGVCISEQGSMSDMLKCADNLLYRAKRNGRNRIEVGDLDINACQVDDARTATDVNQPIL